MERNTLVVFKLGTPWPFRGLQHEGERRIVMHYSHRTAAAGGRESSNPRRAASDRPTQLTSPSERPRAAASRRIARAGRRLPKTVEPSPPRQASAAQ